MSDIRKWMDILSEDSIERGSAVKLSDDYGGGVGTFEQLAEDNPEVAIVNVKGTSQEIPLTSLQKVLDQEREYDEDPCYNITPDLFEPGASVRVKNLWGGGTGDGYGTFVAYSTDGQTAIVNVDSEERTVPVDLVYPADEQQAKDDFASVGSDGSESPFTSAGDNVQDKGQSKMNDMERWMDAVSNQQQESAHNDKEAVAETECDCGDYECTVCFPITEDELDYEADMNSDDDEEDLVELDLDKSEYYNDEDEDEENDYEAGRAGDDEGEDYSDRAVDIDVDDTEGDVPDDWNPPEDVSMHGASEDVSDLLGKIEYIQDMGMSMSDKHYDVEQLVKMRPEAVKRIYAKVTGEELEEDLGNSSDEASDDSFILNTPDERNAYSMVSPGDNVIIHDDHAVYKGIAKRADFLKNGMKPSDTESVVLDIDGATEILPLDTFLQMAQPAELVETSAGGVAIAAGMGKVLDSTGIYEAASIDPADVKSLEKMDVESAKAKAAEMIQNSRTSEKRKAKLIQNVGKANSVVKVLQLMYNLLLAGDGLSTTDSKWQKKYEEAVDPNDDQTRDMFDEDDSELDRMRELAGMPKDDGIDTGGLSKDDFKDLFWDYWDRSSPSSQNQYLEAVFGEQADIEDFSDAAVKAIDYIVNCDDPEVVDKQLHMLRRIGMPLYSMCPDTGEFYPE